MQLPSTLFGLSPPNFSPEKIFYLFFQKSFFEKVFYIFSKNLFQISGNGTFLCFLKGIFRTLAYLELEAYSEPWYIQNPWHMQNTVKHLRWNVL